MTLNCTAFNHSDRSSRCILDESGRSIGTVVAYATVYGLISLVALVGNILVCLVITKNPSMRTVTNVFFFNLAISDILLIIISVPALLAMQVTDSWPFGEAVCKVVPFLNTATLSASIYTMVALAIDRYNAIVHPLRAKVTHTIRRAEVVIAIIWFLSSVVSFPQFLTRTLVTSRGIEYCAEDWSELDNATGKKAYMVTVFIIFFAVPMTIISGAYITIIKRLKTTDCLLVETVNLNNGQGSEVGHSIDEKSASISKNNRKTTMMMLTVIVAFLICMLPINIILIVKQFIPPEAMNVEILDDASPVLIILSVCSAACNPIIYNFFSVKFRRAFADVVKSTCISKTHEDKSICQHSVRTRGSTLL